MEKKEWLLKILLITIVYTQFKRTRTECGLIQSPVYLEFHMKTINFLMTHKAVERIKLRCFDFEKKNFAFANEIVAGVS